MTEGHRGIRSISERHKQQEAEWRPKVPFLRLKEGERAVVRLLASGEEEDPMLATAFFHRTQSQDAGQTRWRLYYCPATEELDCDRCSEGAKRTEQFGVWAYVYKVLRKEQNPRAKQPGDPGWWDKKALGGEVYFKQIVNGPMFWQRGMGHGQSIWKTIVHYYTQDHDLRKRDYEIIRLGSGLSTVIQIMPGPETSKLTAEQKRLANELLPDAFEVLAGREQYPPEGEGDDSSSMETLEDLEEEEVFGGSKKSRRAAVEDDEEEEPAPKAKRRREPEPEEDEEEEAPRRRRRAEPVDEDEEEEEPAPRRTRAAPATKAKRTPPPDDDDDDEEEEEEPPKRRARVARRLEPDDEEEPAPKPKSKTKRTPPPDDDDDEDEEEEIATARQSRRSAVASAASGRRRSTKAASAFDDEEDADDNVQEEDIFDND